MLLKNCKILKNTKFEKVDILIRDNKIEKISENIDITDENIIDIKNRFVTAGFIDVHVHWREPGFSKKETVYTASRAAARGGFTTVMTMPNLNPVPDSLETLNKENLEKFLLNMDIDESFERADKTLEEAKYELQYFKDNYKAIPNHINFYYIGKNDRIIPASKVEKYCQNNNIAYELIACGHYPFSYFTDFKDIINIREENKNEF